MKAKIIKDLMVPLSEYVTVSKDATLFEAVLALEQAQAEADPTRAPAPGHYDLRRTQQNRWENWPD